MDLCEHSFKGGVDSSKISILNKDSVCGESTLRLLALENKLMLDFEKEEEQIYSIQMLPNAFTDFYDTPEHDTLNFKVRDSHHCPISDTSS